MTPLPQLYRHRAGRRAGILSRPDSSRAARGVLSVRLHRSSVTRGACPRQRVLCAQSLPHGRSDCAHVFFRVQRVHEVQWVQLVLNPILALTIFGAGAVAGALGVALGVARGLGGGICLVPFLTLALGFPLKSAAAISLSTVIATSSAVSARRA